MCRRDVQALRVQGHMPELAVEASELCGGVVGLIPAPVPGVTVSRPESARMETGASWRGPGPSGRPALWGLRPPGIPPVVFPPWGGRRPSAASSVLSRKTGAERREPWQTDGLSVFRLQPPGVS